MQTSRRSIALALLPVVALGAGCLEELPRPSTVDDVRVLAIVNTPAESRPGDAVTLTALVVDPLARPVTYRWAACLLPEQGFGFFSGNSETSTSGGNGYGLDDGGTCFPLADAGARWAESLGTDATATLQIPADLFDDGTALTTAYQLPSEAELPAELQTLFLGVAGLNLTVSLHVEVDGRTIVAHKRVNVGLPSLLPDNPANENPSDVAFHLARKVDSLTAPTTAPVPADGRCFIDEADAAPLVRGTRYVLTPINIPDPQPTYAVLLAGSTTEAPFELIYADENWYFSWFVTGGELDRDLTKASAGGANTWRIPEDAPDTLDLWIVVRDGRGGTAWCSSHFTVEDP